MVPSQLSVRLSCRLVRKRRRMPPGRCREKCMPPAYAACDERHARNDFNLLRVTAPSHSAASADVETILFPRRATRMGARRPAPGRERGLMRRTCDAIAPPDRPTQDYDRADKDNTGQERKRRRPCHRSSGSGRVSFPILSRSHIIGFPSGSIPTRNESGFRLDPASISASIPAQCRRLACASARLRVSHRGRERFCDAPLLPARHRVRVIYRYRQ